MRVKIKPLDKLFSQVIKARDKWCQRCGGTGGLQTSHFWGRKRSLVRYDEDNAVLLCFGCHQYFHSNPAEHTAWFKQHLGEEKFNLLEGRASQVGKVDENAVFLYLKHQLEKLK